MTPREAQADVPSTDPPHELLAVIEDLQARLTKLEARDTRGLLGIRFGKGTAAALLAVFLISGTAWGKDFKDVLKEFFGTIEMSNGGCSTYTRLKKGEYENEFSWYQMRQYWVLGYLMAYDRWVSPGTMSPYGYDTSTDNVHSWMDHYCQENPDARLGDAADQLIGEIKARKFFRIK